MHNKTHWKDLSGKRKTGVVLIGLAQVALTAAAYRDLIKRPEEEIEGTKLAWGVALLVNWIGPLTYFAKGRKV